MEARSLAELAVVRLERLGGVRIVDDRLDPRADLLHLLEVGQLHGGGQPLGGHVALAVAEADQQVADDVGPAVVDEIFGLGDAGHEVVEVVHPPRLPAGLEARRPLGIGRTVGAHVDRRRRALEHEQLLCAGAEMRHALDGCGTGSDDADALVGELVEATVGVAAGVVVVPSTGVERVTLEGGDAVDAGKLRTMQWPARHHDVARSHRVTAIGGDDPPMVGVVPTHAGHLGLETGVSVQVEVLADRLAVREDLGGLGVLLLRHVPDLLQQREVHVRLDVARGAGIAVPVPGSAEVAALLDQADVVDARLAEPSAGEESAEAAADDQYLDLVGQRFPFERVHVRIVDVPFELSGDFDVLLVARVTQPLVAFLPVLLAQCIRIERGAPHRDVVAKPRLSQRCGRAPQVSVSAKRSMSPRWPATTIRSCSPSTVALSAYVNAWPSGLMHTTVTL